MDKNLLPYRESVGIMLVNDINEVFIGKRIDTRINGWQMPQGGIDEGEDIQKAVLRELKEEIGTDKVKIIASTKDWLSYDLPDDLILKMWSGRYRGQKQKWFLLRFLGDNSDINLNTEIPEFEDFKWINHNKLIEIIVPFKKQLYEKVVNELKTYL